MHISIDRQSKSWAVFADHTFVAPVKAFEKYEDEAQALATARAWVAEHSDPPQTDPEVVYPFISSMRITYSRPRRKKTALKK